MKKLLLVALLSLTQALVFTGEALLAQSEQLPITENEISYYGITKNGNTQVEIQLIFDSKKYIINNIRINESCLNSQHAISFNYDKKVKVNKKDNRFKCKEHGGISGVINPDGKIEGEMLISLLCDGVNYPRKTTWNANKTN